MACPTPIKYFIPKEWESACDQQYDRARLAYHDYNPLKEENTTTIALFDESTRNFARLGIATPYFRARSFPVFGWTGLAGTSLLKEYKSNAERIWDVALFAASFVPVYGNLIDFYNAYISYQKEGMSAATMINLAGGVFGLCTGIPQFGRFIKLTEGTSALSSARMSYLRLVEDVLDAKGKGIGLENDLINSHLDELSKELTPLLSKIKLDAEKESLRKEAWDLIEKYAKNPSEGSQVIQHGIMQEISRLKSAHSQPFFKQTVFGYSYMPSGIYNAANPLNPLTGIDTAIGALNPERFYSIYRSNGITKDIRAFVRKEYPDTSLHGLAMLGKRGKKALNDIAVEITEKFSGRVEIDNGGASMKEIDSYLDKIVEKGRFPWDLTRIRFIAKNNQTIEELTKHILTNKKSVLLSGIRRAKNLDGSPYQACHIGFITDTGEICEIQIMGKNMKQWYDTDHKLYKQVTRLEAQFKAGEIDKDTFNKGKREILTEEHTLAGRNAFLADGPLSY